MADTEMPALPEGFDPQADWQDVHPELMNPEQRRIAAMQGFYEVQRAVIAMESNAEYMARCAGVTDDELEALARHAEADEEDDGSMPPVE